MPEKQITLSSLSRDQLLSLLNELAFENPSAREKIARYWESLNKTTKHSGKRKSFAAMRGD